MATFFYFTAIVLLLFLCVLLCSVILIQEGKSSGLGVTFGSEAADSVFGTSTADVLKRFTAWLSAVFMIACILLSFWTASLARSNAGQPAVMEEVQETKS